MSVQQDCKPQNKEELLISFLKRYARDINDDSVRKSMKEDLHQVYRDDFRHQYSSVTGCLLQCLKEDNTTALSENDGISFKFTDKLQLLRDNNEMYSDEFIHAYGEPEYQKNVAKLMDHISLEITRLEYITDMYQPTINQAQELSEKTEQLSEKAEQLNTAIETADKDIKTQKLDFVAILGIFSGIVLAFVGGITFVNNTVQGIGNASIYRLMAMAIICGLVLVNSICLTLRYIERLIRKQTAKEVGWPLIVFDIIAVVLLIIVSCVYWFGKPGLLEFIWRWPQ